MNKSMKRGAWLLAVAGALICAVACSGNSEGRDASPTGEQPFGLDAYVCRYPPNLEACDAPPNGFSETMYYCYGCNCATGTPIPACDAVTRDCRYFATSCLPTSYKTCGSNPHFDIQSLCLYCFLQDGGAGVPEDCDKLKAP